MKKPKRKPSKRAKAARKAGRSQREAFSGESPPYTDWASGEAPGLQFPIREHGAYPQYKPKKAKRK